MESLTDKFDKSERGSCPDEIHINRYVLHQCSKKERQEIETHLIKCHLCRMEVVLLIQTSMKIHNEENWAELPERVYNKGMALIKRMTDPQEESYLDICLRFIREQWEIVRHTGTLILQPALATRGGDAASTSALSTVVKEFNGYKVEIDLKRDIKEAVDLQVRVKKSKDETLVPQVSFTLRDEKRQRNLKELIKDGAISFEGLRPGEYSIKIFQQGRSIGDIILDLEKV